MATRCQGCKQPYNLTTKAPHHCNDCGESVCLECLNKSRSKQDILKCPLCLNSTPTPWTVNQNLLKVIEASLGDAKCEPHKRKVLMLCCSPQCLAPPAICDQAECARIHKNQGISNALLSFFSAAAEESNNASGNAIIEVLFQKASNCVNKALSNMKLRLLTNPDKWMGTRLSLDKQSQKLLEKVRKSQLLGVSSSHLAELKMKMKILEDERELEMMANYMQMVKKQKLEIILTIKQAIEKVEANIFQLVIMGINQQQDPNTEPQSEKINPKTSKKEHVSVEPKHQIESAKSVDSTTKHQIESANSVDNSFKSIRTSMTTGESYQQAIKLCYQPNVHLEHDLLRQALGRESLMRLLYSSSNVQPVYFKQNVAGHPNLFVRVQLLDGRIIGSFFKKSYPKKFIIDQYHRDPEAFVYWLDEFKVYRAAKNSKSQFDTSPCFLFSCGCTYNWDGFWFSKDFKEINPDAQQGGDAIRSAQYVELCIPIPQKRVLRFDAYSLQFK